MLHYNSKFLRPTNLQISSITYVFWNLSSVPVCVKKWWIWESKNQMLPKHCLSHDWSANGLLRHKHCVREERLLVIETNTSMWWLPYAEDSSESFIFVNSKSKEFSGAQTVSWSPCRHDVLSMDPILGIHFRTNLLWCWGPNWNFLWRRLCWFWKKKMSKCTYMAHMETEENNIEMSR